MVQSAVAGQSVSSKFSVAATALGFLWKLNESSNVTGIQISTSDSTHARERTREEHSSDENNRATFLLGNGEWESYGYASYVGTKKALSSLELDP